MIPIDIILNLFLFLGIIVILAIILSIGAARGFQFNSCGSKKSCSCNSKSELTTAEKILALIDK